MNEEESTSQRYLEEKMVEIMKPFMEALAKKQTPTPSVPTNSENYWE